MRLELGVPRNTAFALGLLARTSRTLSYAGQFELGQGNVAEARQHFRRALQTAQVGQSDTNVLDALTGLAEVAARQGGLALAYALALTVGQHPASNQSARDRAARLTGDLAGRSDVAVQAQTLSLEDAVAAATRP